MIEFKDFTKSYGKVLACNQVNLSIKEGEAFALIGQNGAGKTTLIKGLLGLLKIDVGSVFIDGKKSAEAIYREEISYLPEKFVYYPTHKVRDAINFYSESFHKHLYSPKEAMEMVGISGLENRRITKLSKGQLQRVGLACAMIPDTKIYLFDEPFSGLDPVGIKEIKDLFLDLKRKGKTLFISSHILSEVEKVCDEFAIMNKGICLLKMTMSELKGQGVDLETFFYQKVKGSTNA